MDKGGAKAERGYPGPTRGARNKQSRNVDKSPHRRGGGGFFTRDNIT